MIDHVTIRTPDLEAARRFYGRTFRLLAFAGEPFESDGFVEWDDFSVAAEADATPATRRLHIGFRAESPGMVDAWWHAMTAAGCADDGPPGPRPAYGPDYYGAFVLDTGGNSVEAVNDGPRRQAGVIDHLWLRVHDLEASTRFYEAVCPPVDHTVERYEGRTQIRGRGATFSLVEGMPTENLHLAFAARRPAMSTPSTKPVSPPATHPTAPPGSGPDITPATTPPTCSIPTATTSRRCSTTAAAGSLRAPASVGVGGGRSCRRSRR